jgi:hypothetical protein
VLWSAVSKLSNRTFLTVHCTSRGLWDRAFLTAYIMRTYFYRRPGGNSAHKMLVHTSQEARYRDSQIILTGRKSPTDSPCICTSSKVNRLTGLVNPTRTYPLEKGFSRTCVQTVQLLDTTQEAKYVERWPSSTSAWAGWSRFDIPVDRYAGVHSLLICTSSPLGFPTCHRASQEENTY